MDKYVELITKALDIIDNYDWYWSMEDSNYKRAKENAIAKRNEFAAIVSKVPDPIAQERLKELWRENYEMTRPYLSTNKMEIHQVRADAIKEELQIKISNKINF